MGCAHACRSHATICAPEHIMLGALPKDERQEEKYGKHYGQSPEPSGFRAGTATPTWF